MAKRKPTEKTQSQQSASPKPSRQERRQAARNDAKAQQTVQAASLLTAARSYTVLLIVCPNVGGGFSPPSESGELYQSLGVFPVGLQCLGQGLVQRVDGGKELIG